MGPEPQEGAVREERFLILGSPLTGGEVDQDGWELQSLRGECSSQSRGGAAQAGSVAVLHAPPA